jgi:peptide/nickel transport system permease protein
MRRFVLRRLLQFVPTFIGVTLITFVLLQLAPGEPYSLMADESAGASAASIAAWRQLKGLDQPLVAQYGTWLWRLVTFDFGSSLIDERPVRAVILEALPPTLLLTGTSLVCIYLAAVPLGILSAVHKGSRGDRVTSTVLFMLYSMPPFWVALLLVVLLGGGEFLSVFPIRGLASELPADAGLLARLGDVAWHLVLPVLCLTYPALARTSRFQRSATLEVIGQDYIRTARAKGLSERAVIVRHALKNSLLPVVTLLSVDLPWLIGGSVIIERIFTIRGMGMVTFEAILRRNYPVIMGVTTLVALVTMLAMLLGDLAIAWLDPRIRLEEEPRT